MHLVQHAVSPGIDFAPEERLNVKDCLPLLSTSGTGKQELDIRLGISLPHVFYHRLHNLCWQLIAAPRFTVVEGCEKTALEHKVSDGRHICMVCHCSQVQA